MSNEFTFEVLTKEHDYDVSGKLNKRSSLALLSQLVNAISFGGLSDVNAMSLQNAMGGRMRLNRLRVGRDLAIVTRTMAKDEKHGFAKQDYNAVIAKLEEGDVSTDTYTESQKVLYEEVIRSGVYNMAQLAFNESADSVLIKKMIEGEGFSLDTPAIQNKVMGTLRSAFFGDTVKMKMEGFQAVVSTTHKTIAVFNFDNGRKGRGAYIQAGLAAGMEHDWTKEEGELVHINSADANIMDEVKNYVLPFDKVKMVSTITTYSLDGTVIKKPKVSEKLQDKSSVNVYNYNGSKPLRTDADDGSYTISNKDLYVVLTPDTLYDEKILPSEEGDVFDEYDDLKENDLIKVRDGLNSYSTYYKWFLEEKYTKEEIGDFIAEGNLTEDITEKYSLEWMKLTRPVDGGIEDIKDTDVYREIGRASCRERV